MTDSTAIILEAASVRRSTVFSLSIRAAEAIQHQKIGDPAPEDLLPLQIIAERPAEISTLCASTDTLVRSLVSHLVARQLRAGMASAEHR